MSKDIEITSAMIDAGIEAYRPFWSEIADCDEGAPARMVREIFEAMRAPETARPFGREWLCNHADTARHLRDYGGGEYREHA